MLLIIDGISIGFKIVEDPNKSKNICNLRMFRSRSEKAG